MNTRPLPEAVADAVGQDFIHQELAEAVEAARVFADQYDAFDSHAEWEAARMEVLERAYNVILTISGSCLYYEDPAGAIAQMEAAARGVQLPEQTHE